MPWRFSLCLMAAFLAGTCGVARAQMPYGAPPEGWCPPDAGYGASSSPEQVGQRDLFYDDNSNLDTVVSETLRRSWFRLEYLHWNIQDPGSDLLGSRMATQNPRSLFQAFDPGNIPRLGAFATVPDLSSVELDNISGIRGTFGIPTQIGAFEIDAMAIGQSTQSERIRPVIDPLTGATIIPAVTLLSSGSPSDSAMILFDTDYRSELRTNLFGSQGNFYFNPMSTAGSISISPVVGIRYVRFYEELEISGTDTASGTSPRINSEAHNNFIGPQAGFRISHDNRYFSLGIEPKLMLGVNRHEDSVVAEDILSPGNRAVDRKEDTDFAPVFDLQGYAKVHLGDNFSLFAGYEILAFSNVARSSDQIRYDSPLVITDPPLISMKKERQPMFTHGLMVGGELRFR